MQTDSALHRCTVFVVDDNVQLLRVLRRKLELDGYVVVTSESGDEAAEMLKSGAKFDLLLSDCVMPGEIQGIDLAGVARVQRPTMPVVLMSGYVGRKNSSGSATTTFDWFLAKPLNLNELSECLSVLLNARAARLSLVS